MMNGQSFGLSVACVAQHLKSSVQRVAAVRNSLLRCLTIGNNARQVRILNEKPSAWVSGRIVKGNTRSAAIDFILHFRALKHPDRRNSSGAGLYALGRIPFVDAAEREYGNRCGAARLG